MIAGVLSKQVMAVLLNLLMIARVRDWQKDSKRLAPPLALPKTACRMPRDLIIHDRVTERQYLNIIRKAPYSYSKTAFFSAAEAK